MHIHLWKNIQKKSRKNFQHLRHHIFCDLDPRSMCLYNEMHMALNYTHSEFGANWTIQSKVIKCWNFWVKSSFFETPISQQLPVLSVHKCPQILSWSSGYLSIPFTCLCALKLLRKMRAKIFTKSSLNLSCDLQKSSKFKIIWDLKSPHIAAYNHKKTWEKKVGKITKNNNNNNNNKTSIIGGPIMGFTCSTKPSKCGQIWTKTVFFIKNIFVNRVW